MDSNYLSANDRLPKRASDWLITLADHPDDPILQDGFQTWLAASPENRRDWDEMNHAWRGLGEIGPLSASGSDAASPDQPEADQSANRQRDRSHRSILGAVACLVLAISAAMVWQSDTFRRWQADHVTGTAELQQVVLSDGSRVELAPRSAIDIAFTDKARRIRLLEGQAFFVVAPGDGRPFVVEAGDVEARDIGTEFDVRRSDEGAEIGVREGVVEVTLRGTSRAAELRPGDWIRVSGPDAMRQRRLEVDQIGSWQKGRLMVQDQPVSAVVDALRPYFAGSIVLIGDRLARQPITGAYNLADPLAALQAVAIAQGADIYRISPWLVVVTSQ